ncbi:hypothetical protein EYF80_062599 [Liparis tanakae]|uniref:Uncharacterized protein n=1 Tax=Liparis tanakae TaxID=230148 RepID=A0A4Z2EEH1_9TELE|nr:hypothetical protein EYF80_062599 [Liparis tanakae]
MSLGAVRDNYLLFKASSGLHLPGSCTWLVHVARARGSCTWLVHVARARGSCTWLVDVAVT